MGVNAPKISTFEGYELDKLAADEDKKPDGKQEKGVYTGRYTKKGKKYYIKKSERFVADNVAEVIGSRILTSMIGEELTVPYYFAPNQKDGVYIASEMREGFVTLKDKAGTLPSPVKLASNPVSDANKQKIDDSLDQNQKQELMRILAGCLLVNDYDVQTGNIFFYGKDKHVAKFDNGWSLEAICSDQNDRVRLFQKRNLIGQAGTHPFGGIPTNHYNDYKLIDSPQFAMEVERLANLAVDFKAVVKDALAEVSEAYKNGDKEAFLKFAEHIGLNKNSQYKEDNFAEMEADELATIISKELSSRLKQRQASMKLLAKLLHLKSLLVKKPLNQKELSRWMLDFQTILQQNFSGQEDQVLKDILPPFKPSRTALFKRLLNRAKTLGLPFEQQLFCGRLLNLDKPLSDLNQKLPTLGANFAEQITKQVTQSKVQKSTVTLSNMASSIRPIQSLPHVEIYPHGTIRGDVISLGDKPAGQEAGMLFYVRDAHYYEALKVITPAFTLAKPGQNIKEAVNELQNSKTMKTIYQQFIDKYHREKPNGLKDVQGTLYQSLFIEYEKILSEARKAGLSVKDANAFFYPYFLEQSLHAAQSELKEVQSNLSSAPDFALEQLERAFNANPVLFGLYMDAIEKRNKDIPEASRIKTYMLKLDYANTKAVPYQGRLANTNTAKKEGLKAYYRSIQKSIQGLNLTKEQKEALQQDIRAIFKAKATPSSKKKDLENKIRDKIAAPEAQALLDKAEKAYDKARLKSVQLKHLAKRVQASLMSSSLDVSIDALREQLATQHASCSGVRSQAIQGLLGTSLEDPNLPQIKVVSEWEKSFVTFDELSEGATIQGQSFPAIQFMGGEPPNPLSESSYMAFKVPNPTGGNEVNVSASSLFPLGKHLALFLTHLDRDGIGKAGQNKGIMVDGAGKIELFGIDFGKSFQKKLKNFKLNDDFSFEQPGERILGVTVNNDSVNLVNMAPFYDTPYVDRMEGVHILAKQYGLKVPEAVKKDFKSVWEDENIQPGSHLTPFNKEREHYQSLIDKNKKRITRLQTELSTISNLNREDIDSRKTEIKNLKQQNKHYKVILKSINEMQGIMEENYKALLETFSKRLSLTKNQLILLDSLEKLVSDPTRASLNGQVLLQHLRVERKNRIPFQFAMYEDGPQKGQPKIDKDGCYQLLIETKDKQKAKDTLAIIKDYVKSHPDLELIIEQEPPAVRFKVGQEDRVFKAFTEVNVATYLGLNTPLIQDTLTNTHIYRPSAELDTEHPAHEGLTYAMPLKLNTPAALRRVKAYPVLATLGIDPYHLRLKLNENNDFMIMDKGIEVNVQDYIKNHLNEYIKTQNSSIVLNETSLIVGAGFDELSQVIKLSIQHMPKKERLLSHQAWLDEYHARKIYEKKSYEEMKDKLKKDRDDSNKAIQKIEKENIKSASSAIRKEHLKWAQTYERQLATLYLSEKYTLESIQKNYRNNSREERQSMLAVAAQYFAKEKKALQEELKKAGLYNPKNPLAQEIVKTEAFFKEHQSLSFKQLDLKLKKEILKLEGRPEDLVRFNYLKGLKGIGDNIQNNFSKKRKEGFEKIAKMSAQKKEFLEIADRKVVTSSSPIKAASERLLKASLKKFPQLLEKPPLNTERMVEGFVDTLDNSTKAKPKTAKLNAKAKRKATEPTSNPLLFSPSNSSKAQINVAITKKQKAIIKGVIVRYKGYYYKEELQGGFSITGNNPLMVIADAQKADLPPLSYTLTCKNAEGALRLLMHNEGLAKKNPKLKVDVSNIIIAGKTYSIDAFRETFDKNHAPRKSQGNSIDKP